MTADRHAPFRIGQVQVEPSRNCLITAVGEQSLEPKIMAVLCLMADHPGEVLSRNDLIDRIWGVEYGGDESLTRAIFLLRKALGDAKTIETISKRGYRLTVSVEPIAAAQPSLLRVRSRYGLYALAAVLLCGLVAVVFLSRPKPAPDAITLMVEPFSAPPADTASARAVSDGLAGAIAGQALYKVKSVPYSASSNAELTYNLKGDVDSQPDRISVQLVDAHSGAHLWSQTYARTGQSEDDLINLIASEIPLPLLKAAKADLRARPLDSLKPWELNLLVTWVPGTEETPGPPNETSFTLQKRSLELNPDYAPAHATFAEMLAYHALFDPPSDTPAARQRARDHAEKALQFGGYDPEVLYHVATYYRFTGDRERATALLRRVLTLQPSNLTAQADLDFVTAQCQADSDTAVRDLEALEARLSPANPARWVVLSHLADLSLSQGDFARAADYAGQSRDIVVTTWNSLTLAAALAALHRPDADAIAHENDAQWTHLDFDWFAANSLPRLCLHGPRTAALQADFAALRKTSG